MTDSTATAATSIAVTHVADFAMADDFTKKHTPYLTMERAGDKVRISVEVGHEVPHPNTLDHYIAYVELRVADATIARFDFTPQAVYPKVSVIADLPAGTMVKAIELCNLHSYWSYEQAVPA